MRPLMYLAVLEALSEGGQPEFMPVDAYGRLHVGGDFLERIADAVEDTAAATVQGNVGYSPSNADHHTTLASQTAQAVGDGAIGDYLLHAIITPLTTSPGKVWLKDGTAGTDKVIFAGGASSVTGLAPIIVPLNWTALASGGWRCTTDANVNVHFSGQFIA